ncbi:hypothetical protein MIR68_010916 [Amoeboaphelidium protococcarum]|nr:hypothetical protein MIR68_010916 [Amoeboaphelidium protococcarum]
MSINGLLQDISFLVLFSWLGLSVRVLLEHISQQSLLPFITAQCLGCFVYGMVKANQQFIESRYKLKLATYILVGFCGSLTTFSSMNMDAFDNLILLSPSDGNKDAAWIAENIVTFMAVFIITLSSSFGLYKIGFGLLIVQQQPSEDYQLNDTQSTERTSQQLQKQSQDQGTRHDQVNLIEMNERDTDIEDPEIQSTDASLRSGHSNDNAPLKLAFIVGIISALYVSFIIVFILLSPQLQNAVVSSLWLYRWNIALISGPPGTILRWQLSRLNANTIDKWWSALGTLCANTLGTAVLAALEVIIRLKPDSLDAISTTIIIGLQLGFCGCLTTLSTFIHELNIAKSKRVSIAYLTVSIIADQILLLCILGIPLWIQDSG